VVGADAGPFWAVSLGVQKAGGACVCEYGDSDLGDHGAVLPGGCRFIKFFPAM